MEEQTATTQDVYSIITNRIIEQLQQGTIPWRMPWTVSGIPTNLISKKAYRGINLFLLASLGYEHNYFVSYKQAQELGATIKQYEKGHLVVFWKWLEDESDEQNDSIPAESNTKRPMLRYYKVFNIAQLENVPINIIPKKQERQIDPIVACEKILHNMPMRPEILHEGNQACYVPHLDKIFMPTRKNFLSSEFYYSTLFHEIMHSTGHETRLNRKGIADYSVFDHEAYSQEELVAEIGACFLNSHAGINTEDMSNNIAYIQSWLKKLEDDKRMIIYASAQAQKAVDWVMRVEREFE